MESPTEYHARIGAKGGRPKSPLRQFVLVWKGEWTPLPSLGAKLSGDGANVIQCSINRALICVWGI